MIEKKKIEAVLDMWRDRIIRGKIKKLSQEDILKMLTDIKEDLIKPKKKHLSNSIADMMIDNYMSGGLE